MRVFSISCQAVIWDPLYPEFRHQSPLCPSRRNCCPKWSPSDPPGQHPRELNHKPCPHSGCNHHQHHSCSHHHRRACGRDSTIRVLAGNEFLPVKKTARRADKLESHLCQRVAKTTFTSNGLWASPPANRPNFLYRLSSKREQVPPRQSVPISLAYSSGRRGIASSP